MDTKEFGSFISSQRKAQGFTQKELADNSKKNNQELYEPGAILARIVYWNI